MDAASSSTAASEDVGPPPYNHKSSPDVNENVDSAEAGEIHVSEPESPSELLRAALALVRAASPEEPLEEAAPVEAPAVEEALKEPIEVVPAEEPVEAAPVEEPVEAVPTE